MKSSSFLADNYLVALTLRKSYLKISFEISLPMLVSLMIRDILQNQDIYT
jgi:hypothetical protein